MNNETVGIIIGVILFLIVILPLIIGGTITKIKTNKTQEIFGSKVNKKEKKNQQYQQQQYQQYLNQQQQYQQYINQQQQYQQYISQQQQYQQHKQNYNRLPYSLIESVLTNYEKILYSILAPFCSKYNFILLSKVRIADFVKPLQQNNRSNFYHWFNRIASKHVDFLICQPQTFRPLVAIELDDYTHKYKSRQERDIFVDDVYASIGLPVLHITQLQEYNIVRQLSEILNVNLTIDNAPIQ